MYTKTSPILNDSPTPLDLDALYDWLSSQGAKRLPEVRRYLETLISGAVMLRIDPTVLVGQSWLETGHKDTGLPWQSEPWVTGLNSSGLGMTKPGGYPANPDAQKWETGTLAALGHLAHMVAYLYLGAWPDYWPEPWPEPTDVDRRFGLVVRADKRARVINDLTNTWALDNAYGQKIADRANRILDIAGKPGVSIPPEETEQPVDNLIFGRVPKPKVTKAYVFKPAHTSSGWGYDYVPGGRKIVGMVHHEWLGVGSRDFHMRFFGCPNGERCRNALVDVIIMKNGEIIEINDPFGVRAGWASGGGVGLPGGLEGDGPAFVAKFGTFAINARLSPIEYQKFGDENFTQQQIASGGAYSAWIHDRDGQPWDQHPFVPKYDCVLSFLHFEFGTTNCGKNELDDITKVQAVTKGIMRQHQASGTGEPIPPEVPELPPVTIPGGLTLAEAKARFGEATRHRDGTSTGGFGFDTNGPISLTWAHRAAVEKEWPSIQDWYVLDDSKEVFQIVTFSNNWRLVQVAERAGWNWLDFMPVMIEAAA